MKIVFIIYCMLVIICFQHQLKAQTKEYVRESRPVFLASSIFLNDLKKDVRFRKTYELLKRENKNQTFRCSFRISKQGKVISDKYNDEEYFKLINSFVNEKFNRYLWRSGNKGCNTCPYVGYGMLTINFIPKNNIVEVFMTVGNGLNSNKFIFEQVIPY